MSSSDNFRPVINRKKRYTRRVLRRDKKVLPLYFDGFEKRKETLRLAASGSHDQDVALYDIRSSIVDPLARMGYVVNSDELYFTPWSCWDDVKKLDRIIDDIKAGNRIPIYLNFS